MRSSLLLLGSVVVMGCSGTVMDASEARDAEAASSTASAIIVVERSTGPGDAVRADTIAARFVRAKQGIVDDAALRTAGVAQDIPAAGTCLVQKDADARDSRDSKVELVDVGHVTVDASKSALLSKRTMPDPAGFVSGSFYTTRSTDMVAPGAPISLHVAGNKDVPAFAVNAVVPRDVDNVRVSGTSGIEVQWDAGEASDLVYVDVLAPVPHMIVRCSAADVAGRLVVPQSFLDASRERIEEGQVVVHRVHREPFRAVGIEPGEVRFDIAKVVAFRR